MNPSAVRVSVALTQIDTMRRELDELECALKGMPGVVRRAA